MKKGVREVRNEVNVVNCEVAARVGFCVTSLLDPLELREVEEKEVEKEGGILAVESRGMLSISE